MKRQKKKEESKKEKAGQRQNKMVEKNSKRSQHLSFKYFKLSVVIPDEGKWPVCFLYP